MDEFPFPIREGFNVDFNSADIEFILPETNKTVDWLKAIAEKANGSVSELNYIFCSDEYLHRLNVEYLQHDTLTDILTFPINLDPIQSDIYISIDRVRENATRLKQPFDVELRRVMAHGLLHLLGFRDKTEKEFKIMREQENAALLLWSISP